MTDNIPKTMHAVVLTGHGGFDKLKFHRDWPVPVPESDEVLIRVAACGLNNTDVNTRSAWYSKGNSDATTGDALVGAEGEDGTWGGASVSFPRIQGADAVGTVIRVGDGVTHSLIGRRVIIDGWLRDWNDPLNREKAGYFGSECDGGYAQYTKVSHQQVHPVDTTMSDAELATFACSYVTAENMLNRAAVTDEDTVLITGASGGVGSALIQLANRRGAKCVALCGAGKADAVKAVGPLAVIDRASANLGSALYDAIGKDSVDVVADVVGGVLWPQLINALTRGGRYTCAGAIGGPIVEFDLRTFYLRDLTFTGATVPPPGVFQDLIGYIERDEIQPLLAATYPLEELHTAQQAFIDKRHVGNIVVEPFV
ncbi:alcohol dehydrogenase family protein [Arenicellales bacterium nBUS_45]